MEDKDVVSSWRYFREGTLGLVGYVKSLRGVSETAHLSFDDPVASGLFAVDFAERILGGATRTAARAVGLVGPAVPGRAR